MTRQASCGCGQLRVTCEGEPVRISICHCDACQRRTGSVFGTQARFHRDQVTEIHGRSTQYSRLGDSGNRITFHFCPTCGSTLYWTLAAVPEVMAIAVGAFGDPGFPPPRHSVYEERRHSWVFAAGELPMEHME